MLSYSVLTFDDFINHSNRDSKTVSGVMACLTPLNSKYHPKEATWALESLIRRQSDRTVEEIDARVRDIKLSIPEAPRLA
jgi:hypothetical protein